nr:chromaffin granule peptide [Ovis aries]
VAELDQLLHY